MNKKRKPTWSKPDGLEGTREPMRSYTRNNSTISFGSQRMRYNSGICLSIASFLLVETKEVKK